LTLRESNDPQKAPAFTLKAPVIRPKDEPVLSGEPIVLFRAEFILLGAKLVLFKDELVLLGDEPVLLGEPSGPQKDPAPALRVSKSMR
jgi:hypothetical protein